MTKHTRRTKKIKSKGKTRKFYGGKSHSNSKKSNKGFEQSPGIFDIIGSKLSGYAKDTGEYISEKGWRLVGLQPIKKGDEEEERKAADETVTKVDNQIHQLTDAASGTVTGIISGAEQIGSDVVDVADKTSAALIEQVNDVLESPKVEDSISQAAEETAEIGEEILENVNEKLSTPELKEETKLVLDNVADYADIAVESMDEPINKAIDSLNDAGTQAVSGAASGAIKVGTDMVAAVPYLGAVVEFGKVVNDASAAIGDVVEAGTQATSTVSKVVDETSKNISEGIEKLEEKKEAMTENLDKFNNVSEGVNDSMGKFKEVSKDGKKVSSRVNKSIDDFENPFPSTGGGKTRSKYTKKMFKKTKRVRFAV
jgi:ABC-type transporter Mla subunit MlaD